MTVAKVEAGPYLVVTMVLTLVYVPETVVTVLVSVQIGFDEV